MSKVKQMMKLEGIGVSPGVAIAPAFVVRRSDPPVSSEKIDKSEIKAEKQRFIDAIFLTREQLERTKNIIAKNMGSEQARLIDSQLALLQDKSIYDRTIESIEEDREEAAYAFTRLMNAFLEQAKQTDDPFFRERIQEFADLRRRLVSNLLGNSHDFIPHQKESRILVIDHLAPSETAQLFDSNYIGIVCEVGGETSHIAIMARTMEIPAVLGVENATKAIGANIRTAMDGGKGVVYANPDSATIEEYVHRIEHFKQVREVLMKEVDAPHVTLDGRELIVASNIELPEEARIMKKYRSQGVGLFRTELLFMTRRDFPSEDLQTRIYQRIINECDGETAIIRTFDIGGDKMSQSLDHHLEPNPFLGWRAIRIGLDFPHLLKAQIRAILKASVEGKCAIMFPMISNLDEVRKLTKMVENCKEELEHEEIEFDDNMPVGIMVEVPSAALMAGKMAKYLDFMSIGTNDLIQYTLAADRGNEKVAKLYRTYNPAVIELIRRTIDAGHREKIWVGMCGEMAGKALAIPLLIGLGLDEFSVNPSQIPLVRGIIRRLNYSDCRQVANDVLELDSHDEVVNYLENAIKRLVPHFVKYV